MPSKWQWKSVRPGEKRIRQSHLPQERGASGTSCVGITRATYGVVAGDGSCFGCGIPTQAHVRGGETGEAAGEIEPGQAGPLVPRKCGISKS